jgi:ribosome modulation factor
VVGRTKIGPLQTRVGTCMKTPYEFGYEAFAQRDKCPYDESTLEQADWWEGWLDAANDSVNWEGE